MIDISKVSKTQPLQIIIGAGRQSYPGWLSSHKEQLDLCSRTDWEQSFLARKADALLCEHVWEHLSEEEGRFAAELCYEFLKPGGFLRCAVPDGNFPVEAYQELIQVGGPGPVDHPAADHKIVYDYRLFVDVFEKAGFEVELLEYCDEQGRFHYHQWDLETGPIARSLLADHRNKDGKIRFVSLIVEAKKPIQKS